MKKLFAVLAFVLLTTAVFAQEDETPDPNHGRADCRTIEQSNNRAVQFAGVKVFITLRGVDMGFEEPTDVVIYTNGHDYVAVAFVGGCAYAAHEFKDEEEVAGFVNANSKHVERFQPTKWRP